MPTKGSHISERHKEIISRNNSGLKNYMFGKFGKDAPTWTGGKKRNKAGWYLYTGNIDGKTTYRAEHRLIAEKALGRPLKSDEIVHHVNCNPYDNRNENLVICDVGYHRWLHERMARLYAQEHFAVKEINKCA